MGSIQLETVTWGYRGAAAFRHKQRARRALSRQVVCFLFLHEEECRLRHPSIPDVCVDLLAGEPGVGIYP